MATIQVNKLKVAGILGSFAILLGALAYLLSKPRTVTLVLPSGDPYTYGIMLESARILPANDWTDTIPQVERAYCVTDYTIIIKDPPTAENRPKRYIMVENVVRAPTSTALSWKLTGIQCPDSVPIMHTHLPISCHNEDKPEDCVYGGILAFFCQPSKKDYQSLLEGSEPFGIIQCGRDQFVFYYP